MSELQREVTKIFKSGSNSSTLIIPKQFAKQFGLDEPCHVVIESTADGITLKKLELR